MKRILILLSFLYCYRTGSAQALVPENVNARIDLVYKTIGSWQGKLDLYVPRSQNKKPLVIYVHGGGWTHGRKEAEYEKIKVFIENGFAVANVEYRLAGQAPAPAAIEDVHCAIAFLIQHAEDLGTANRKIVLMGASAGAHLALLTGLKSDRNIFTGDCKPEKLKVAAIISKYGPTDLLTWEPATREGSASASWLGNHRTDTAFIKALSPVSYVNDLKIPVLFIHGDQDRTVPVGQSEKLHALLLKHGYPSELHSVPNGKHGNFGKLETERMDQKMLDFLSRYVR